MSNLQMINNEMRISSREVTQMMDENKHSNLIRKIEQIDKVLLSSKMSSVNYWVESSYIDSTGRRLKEYLVTKQGCELLAHKSTGEKGILFTVKYMERFKAMELQLKNNTDSYMIDDPIERAIRWVEEQKEKMIYKRNLEEQKLLLNEYRPKVNKYNSFLEADGLYKVTNIADMFGLTARRLNKILENFRIQYKQGAEWSLYAAYKDKGYAQGVATTITHNDGSKEAKYTLKWTSKGVDFIASKLESIGIYPVIINQNNQLTFN